MTQTLLIADAQPDGPRARRRRQTIAAAVLLATVVIAVEVTTPLLGARSASGHFADANDGLAVKLGKQIYMERCASCHGRYLQGQPLWQLVDRYSGQRAPAHDQTGHTWEHADETLFELTKYGHLAAAPQITVSAMPAFKDVLDDHDILAVIGFIKARWPIGLRVLQAMRNPDRAGMPAGADRADWTFPPDCQAAGQSAVGR